MRSDHDISKKGRKIAKDMYKLFSEAAEIGCAAGAEGNPVNAIFIASSGAIGALHVLASLLGHYKEAPGEEIQAHRHINPVSMLFAALLAYNICPTVDEKGDSESLFSPEVTAMALQMLEQLGFKPEGKLRPDMLSATREAMENSTVPLSTLLEARRVSRSSGNLH